MQPRNASGGVDLEVVMEKMRVLPLCQALFESFVYSNRFKPLNNTINVGTFIIVTILQMRN